MDYDFYELEDDHAAPVDHVLAPNGSLDNATKSSNSSSLVPAEITTGQLSSPSVLTPSPSLSSDPNTSLPSPSSGTPYPLAQYINYDSFSFSYHTFVSTITSGRESKSFKEVVKHEGWRNSMQHEI